MNNEKPLIVPSDLSEVEYIGHEVVPKDGWKTSQGQLTALFVVASLILSLFGITKTPEEISGYVELANTLVTTALPIITAAISLIYYIISRGKIQSNSLWANAQIQVSQNQNPPQMIAPLVPDRFTRVLGGDDWKDPERYGNILKIASALGVPGANQIDKVNDKFDLDGMLERILEAAKRK